MVVIGLYGSKMTAYLCFHEPLSDDVACLDIEDVSKGRPSDDQVMLLIKERTGATNSSAFQQLTDDIKRSVLIELKNMRASLRQLRD